MSSITKTPTGAWRAQIKLRRNGVILRDSQQFDTQRAAKAWAARREAEMGADTAEQRARVYTVADALDRYAREVVPLHKGAHWELVRIEKMRRTLPTTLPLSALTPDHLSDWRDQALQKVSPASVDREMNIISSVLTHARKDWRWMTGNPMADVRRPPAGPSRSVVYGWRQMRRLLRSLGYRTGQPPATVTQHVAWAFLLAVKTGMRAGEIVGLEWPRVGPKSVELAETKNGASRRVPLSLRARRTLDVLRSSGQDRPIMVSSASLDALFRKYRILAGLDGFTFHDSRHTAATLIGARVGHTGRLSFPEFCAMFGWRDPKFALVYCNPTADQIADKLG